MAFACLPFLHHGRVVMSTYIHHFYLGVFALDIILGIFPNMDKILILLKDKCPILWYHLRSYVCRCSAARSSWIDSITCFGSRCLSGITSTNLLRFSSLIFSLLFLSADLTSTSSFSGGIMCGDWYQTFWSNYLWWSSNLMAAMNCDTNRPLWLIRSGHF